MTEKNLMENQDLNFITFSTIVKKLRPHKLMLLISVSLSFVFALITDIMNITRRKTRRRANGEGGDLGISFKDAHNVAA